MKLMKGIIKKRGQMWDTLVPWIIGLAVLVALIFIIVILKGKGEGAIEFFKNLVRFGK